MVSNIVGNSQIPIPAKDENHQPTAAFSIVHSIPKKNDSINSTWSKILCQNLVLQWRQNISHKATFPQGMTIDWKINGWNPIYWKVWFRWFSFSIGWFLCSIDVNLPGSLKTPTQVFCSVRGPRLGGTGFKQQPKKKNGSVRGECFFTSPFCWIFVGLRWCLLIL